MGMLLHHTLKALEEKRMKKGEEKPVEVPEIKEPEAETVKKTVGRRKTSK